MSRFTPWRKRLNLPHPLTAQECLDLAALVRSLANRHPDFWLCCTMDDVVADLERHAGRLLVDAARMSDEQEEPTP